MQVFQRRIPHRQVSRTISRSSAPRGNLFATAACLILILQGSTASSQERTNTLNKSLGLGFHLAQFQRDFGMGVNVTSPLFLFDAVAVRARANFMFHEHVHNADMTWTPYWNASLGLVGVSGYVGDRIRLYGEGGAIALFPAPEFSSSDMEIGGYGTFGFELFPHDAWNYYIELGGIGTGATADRIPTSPIYSNGFMIMVGMRMYLKDRPGT